jgi:Cytidylyltransferase-like
MRTLVIYPGRFQPGHLGHKDSYEYLVDKFGEENVYVATSDVTAPVNNPFNFSDKVQMLSKLGIPASHIVKVRNPYQAQEIVKDVEDPEDTVLIFAVSKKDMNGDDARFKFGIKKNGDPSYMQPYPDNGKKLKPLSKHAYVIITPTVDFKVMGEDANSATTIREKYINGNDNDREHIIHDLYGIDDSAIKELFDKKLGVAKKLIDVVVQEPNIDGDVIDQPMPVVRNENKQRRAKLAKLLESTLAAEREATLSYHSTKEDLFPNYIDEKTGRKFY